MDDSLLARPAAVERVLALREDWRSGAATVSVPASAIGGRVLAEAVVAERDSPPHDFATMDGFAFDATADGPFALIDASVSPEDEPPTLEPGTAVRIATGAPLPSTANAVCKREEATVTDGALHAEHVAPGDHVYGRGTNVAAGETVFEAGRRLSPKDAILLCDLGVESVTVRERQSAAVLATGTEIHEGRQADLDSDVLVGLLDAWGADPSYEGTVPDDFETVRDRIATLATDADVVVTSGGTSVGDADHVVAALSELGEVAFHGVAVRPGKPVAVARLPDHDAVAVAVPGKPVAAHTAATLVLRPYVVGEQHTPTVRATLARDLGFRREGVEYAVPVALEPDGEDPVAMPLGHVDSALAVYEDTFEPSVLSASSRALVGDGFFLADRDREAGEAVDVVPYSAIE